MTKYFPLTALTLAASLASLASFAEPILPAPSAPLFQGTTPLSMRLTAPISSLFQLRQQGNAPRDSSLEKSVPGQITYLNSQKALITVPVQIMLRGNTSETDCPFPKMKFAFDSKSTSGTLFQGIETVDLGTHCGLEGHTAMGRLADGKSPFREAIFYQMMDAMKIDHLYARPTMMTYTDTAGGANSISNPTEAFFLEDLKSLLKRAQATEIDDERTPVRMRKAIKRGHANPYAFEDVADAKEHELTMLDAARVDFLEWMVGNTDYSLCEASNEQMGADAGSCLYNLYTISMNSDKKWMLFVHDFDLAQAVNGAVLGYSWNDRVVQVYQPLVLKAAAQEFLARKRDVYAALQNLKNDSQGQRIYKGRLAAFYKAMQTFAEQR